MTNPIEQEFYKAFDIEPKYYCSYHDCNCPIEDVDKFNKKCPKQAVTKECDVRSTKLKYPPITNRRLLELICVTFNQVEIIEIYRTQTVESLKDMILKKLIICKDDVYTNVRKIMGVGDE